MKNSALALVMAFASMGQSQMNALPQSTQLILGRPSYIGRLTPLTKKQKARRKLNKIGRKTRKLNFKN